MDFIKNNKLISFSVFNVTIIFIFIMMSFFGTILDNSTMIPDFLFIFPIIIFIYCILIIPITSLSLFVYFLVLLIKNKFIRKNLYGVILNLLSTTIAYLMFIRILKNLMVLT